MTLSISLWYPGSGVVLDFLIFALFLTLKKPSSATVFYSDLVYKFKRSVRNPNSSFTAVYNARNMPVGGGYGYFDVMRCYI